MNFKNRIAIFTAVGLCAAAPLFAGFPQRGSRPAADSANTIQVPNAEEKDTYTDEEDYVFLVDLARAFHHPDVSDKIFIVAQKSRRAPSYPANFRRLKSTDRDFLLALAEKIKSPHLSERLRKIAEKVPA